jgi:UDP-2,3-diacylglucosamine pyrophosphatase LpxH
MLAIISDLHFCDGTATDKNVQADAFKLALGDIYQMARPLADKNGSATVELVLLGDVFDLLRTERWFEDEDGTPVPLAERPWGSAGALGRSFQVPETVLVRARSILDTIIGKNQDALAYLRGAQGTDGLAYLRDAHGQIDERVRLRTVLLPGNHDRLALCDEHLYSKMREALGAEDERTLSAEGIFRHRLAMEQYGVLARHGHEWDPWNFEGFDEGKTAADYEDDDYKAAPIGDPITTELAARVPYEMRRRLAGEGGLSDEDKNAVYRRLQRIEDVRPLFASLQWAYAETANLQSTLGPEKGAILRDAVREVVRTIVEDFRALEFFNAWVDKHHRIFHFGPPEQLSTVLKALSLVTPDTVNRLGSVFGRILDSAPEADPYRASAAREELDAVGREGLRFVVYGHTHDPVQASLSATAAKQGIYLNSGTFRQRIFRTDDKQGFVGSEHMSYLCFFRPEEAAAWRAGDGVVGPAFQAWMGARSR